MASNNPSPASRIRKLKLAAERARKLKRGTLLSSKPMSEMVGVSWVSLREWCNDIPGFEESGVFTRGGNGVEWEFKPGPTIRFLEKHFSGLLKSQTAKNRKIRRAAGVALPDAEDEASFQETKDLVNMTVTVVSAAEKQQRYTPTEDMLAFIEGYNQAVVSGIMGVRTRIDPQGNLPPHIRTEIDDHLRSVATGAHEQAKKFIEEASARLQQAGAGRTG